MQYLAQMKRPKGASPFQEEKKILAGGPISGTIGFAMIVEAGSALEANVHARQA